MLLVDTALALRAAGLEWDPVPGDRFVVAKPDMFDQPFVLSDVVADVHDYGGRQVIGFNGTVEWALDSVHLEDTVWLPYEHQLRDRVEPWLRRLERGDDGYYRVVLVVGGEEVTVEDPDPAQAYGLALLKLLSPD